MNSSTKPSPPLRTVSSLQADQPLLLAVHTMPLAGVSASSRIVSGRWKMFAVLLVCAAPVIASYFTYYVIRPEGRRNFGELIAPQRAMPPLETLSSEGRFGDISALKGQWLLVSVSGAACSTECEKNLYFQRQLRESLGREMGRLDRVWLVTDSMPTPPALKGALAESIVLRVSPDALSRWLVPASGHVLSEHLYVVDPFGNWMMRFPANMDAEAGAKAKRDLDRLLRASSGWDQEGRAGNESSTTPVSISKPR